MSDLFFTNKMTDFDVADFDSDKITSLMMSAYPTRDDIVTFRIGFLGAQEVTALVYMTNPSFRLSFDRTRDYQTTLDYQLTPGNVGSTVYVKLSVDLDAQEGSQQDVILVSVDGVTTPLNVDYFVAESNKGFTGTAAVDKYFGENTSFHIEQFESNAEVVTIRKYQPINKPLIGALIPPFKQKHYRSVNAISEFCNPFNRLVGWQEPTTYHVQCFIGSRSITQNLKYESTNLDVDYGDNMKIAIHPEFAGFMPTPFLRRVRMPDLISGAETFQFTQWTLLRENREYALTNIQPIYFFGGEFLYYAADLVLIAYPSTQTEGFLPWNQLYDDRQKVIDYVRGFEKDFVDDGLIEACFENAEVCPPIDPDPYFDPYCGTWNPFADLVTIWYGNEVSWFQSLWWDNRFSGQNYRAPTEAEPLPQEFDTEGS